MVRKPLKSSAKKAAALASVYFFLTEGAWRGKVKTSRSLYVSLELVTVRLCMPLCMQGGGGGWVTMAFSGCAVQRVTFPTTQWAVDVGSFLARELSSVSSGGVALLASWEEEVRVGGCLWYLPIDRKAIKRHFLSSSLPLCICT